MKLALAAAVIALAGAASAPGVASYEGVYKYRFQNALVDGERFESENILEFDGIAFPAASRRTIRYLPRLKASREFKEALAEAE